MKMQKSKNTKRVLCILFALVLTLSTLPFTALIAFANTADGYEYIVLSESDKTCEISKFFGETSGPVTVVPDSLDGYTVTSIGDWAFQGRSEITNIVLPSQLKNIGMYAFADLTWLKSVTVPDGVTNIGYGAFRDCKSLSEIILPDSLITIGATAFSNTAYYNDGGNWNVFDVLYIGKYLIDSNYRLTQTYQIKDGTRVIADGAFSGRSKLETILIPDSVISIGADAFSGCSSLNSVDLPDNLIWLGNYAFLMCSALTEIHIPQGITELPFGLFDNCSALTSVTLPNSLQKVGAYAFAGCISLTQISIPTATTEIDSSAFLRCTAIQSFEVAPNNAKYVSQDGVLFNKEKTELVFYPAGRFDTAYTVPNGTTHIGDNAFYYAEHLENVVFPNSVTDIGEYAFHSSALKTLTLPRSVENIGYFAFSCCASLTDISILNRSVNFADGAFSACSSLKAMTIPDRVTSLGNMSYYYCTSLESINIPIGVTSIGEQTFYGCSALTDIILPESITQIDDSAFSESAITTIYGYADSFAESFAIEKGYTFIALQKLNDTATGVSIGECSFNNLPVDTILTVELSEETETATAYTIALQTADGMPLTPANAVTVSIPLPTTDGKQYRVYQQEADGSYTNMLAGIQNGYLVFSTDNLDTFIVTTERLGIQLGDVNGDDKINAVDARWVLQASSGTRTLDNTQTDAADVNGDGKVNAVDARWILQIASGARTV